MYLMLSVMVVFRRSLISLMSLPKPAHPMIQMLKAGKDCLTPNSEDLDHVLSRATSIANSRPEEEAADQSTKAFQARISRN
jgi:hypothetical protein